MDGPNTLQHFHDFSLDSVISELRAHTPDVHRLFMTLGGTSRNVTSDDSHPCVEKSNRITVYPLESTFCKGQRDTTSVSVYAHSTCNTQTGESYQCLSNHELMRRHATYRRPNVSYMPPHQFNELLIVITPCTCEHMYT